MSNIGFLFVGYGFIWVVLGGYLFSLHRRHQSLSRQVDRMEMELEAGAE